MRNYGIKAVIDVRANPYSRMFPFYNLDNIKGFLNGHKIYYASFADEFGGRPKDASLYTNGKADFQKIIKSENFSKGCARLADALEKFNVCLMCAQKDPIICHRAILISHQFRLLYKEATIFHITPDGLESQENLDRRVLNKFHKGQAHLLSANKEQELAEAYLIQLEDTCV